MRNSRHTFLNLGKREQRGSKRLVKQPYRPLSTPARFFSLCFSLSLLPAPDTPEFFFVLCHPPVRPHPRRESRTHDAMANGERTTHAPDMIFFLLSSLPHSASCKARGGLVVGSTGRWSKGVATGNANELHERRQIEQHTTMVSSCQLSPTLYDFYDATTNLIESWLCINTAAYVVIGSYRNRTLNAHKFKIVFLNCEFY